MYHSSRKSLSMAFILGLGAGIFINALFQKKSTSADSPKWFLEGKEEFLKPLKQKVQHFKILSLNLFVNPIPDLYKATDSLTLSEEDLIHGSA
ncbi:MAG: hypothetical protein WD381_02265 [Balneolaceae bacterium]